ncbi:MAG: UDP-3-O-(3-hydroxymyristoyl)glucosamine N-acyltransferase [Bacteriovoracaceae bacterium]|nr:UDP-3-O-(3-hydroxymyristoyl)glucosamine N-acyltransferase [Bacteriovoracaceae bacterium]
MLSWKHFGPNFLSDQKLWGEISSNFHLVGILTKEHIADFVSDTKPNWCPEELSDRILLIQNLDYLKEIKSLLGKIKNDNFIKNNIIVLQDSLLRQECERFDFEKYFSAAFTHPHVPQLKCLFSKLFFDKIQASFQWHLDGRQNGTSLVHPTAKIAQQVFIGENSSVGSHVTILPGAVIGPNVVIEEGTTIFPNVTIYPFTRIGKNVRVHSGSIIGSDGFGYEFNGKTHEKIWHFGGVIIEDNVELGAGVCVDMGTFYPTIIRSGTKIDNQVQVGHNTQIGNHVILCGQAGTAGSSKIGNYSVLGGRVALGPQCELGDQCQIAGGAMVTKSWPSKSILGGHPARPLDEWMRGVAYLKRMVNERKKN